MEIDLAEFMDESADQTQSDAYCLHAVHRGNFSVGLEPALIKPDNHAPWLLFDRGHVMPAMTKNVLEDSYGGGTGGAPPVKRNSSTYVLVYVRKSMVDEVFLPRTEDEVPFALREWA